MVSRDRLTSLALLGLLMLGCGGTQSSTSAPSQLPPGAAISTQTEAPTSTPTKQELAAIDRKLDAVCDRQFSAILPQVMEKVGPGATEGNISLGTGVLFSAIPANRLAQEEAPGAIVGQGIEALTNKEDMRKIYPIDHNKRIVSAMTLRMNPTNNEPVAERFNPRRSTVLAEEVVYARDIHSRATDTPITAYKGVSMLGMNMHFLYVDRDGKQVMVPVEPDPALGFVPGQELPAEKVFAKLKELVKKRAEVQAPN